MSFRNRNNNESSNKNEHQVSIYGTEHLLWSKFLTIICFFFNDIFSQVQIRIGITYQACNSAKVALIFLTETSISSLIRSWYLDNETVHRCKSFTDFSMLVPASRQTNSGIIMSCLDCRVIAKNIISNTSHCDHFIIRAFDFPRKPSNYHKVHFHWPKVQIIFTIV